MGNTFNVDALGKNLKRVIKKHGLPKWTLYQIRHRVAMDISFEHGQDHAKAVLGNSSFCIKIYDHSTIEKAKRVVDKRDNSDKMAG